MKKSLIALAVLAASGASMAQSSVTLYGIADVWLGSAKDTITNSAGVRTSNRDTVLESGGVSGSRFGFKGTEDLGGGLKANFVLEQGFSIDTGVASSAGFSRQATVGLSGGFGEVQLGKAYTAYDDIRGTADNTFDANFGSTDLTWVGYNASPNNTIKYVSPTISGFSGAVSYSFGEDKNTAGGTNKPSDVVSLNIQYAAGPLFAAYGYQREKSGAGGEMPIFNGLDSFFTDTLASYAPGDLAAGADATSKYNFLTGSYDFGVAKLVGGYNTAKFSDVGGEAKAKEYQIGFEVPLSASLGFAAGYAQSTTEFDGVDLTKAKAYSAMLNYSLSKRTSVYAALAQVKTTSEFAGDPSQVKGNLYAIGLKHSF